MPKIIFCPQCGGKLFVLHIEGTIVADLIAYCEVCKKQVKLRRTRSGKLYSVAWERK